MRLEDQGVYLHGWRRVARRVPDCRGERVLLGADAVRAALHDDLRREERVEAERLDVGLLAHGPRAGRERVLPPAVVPVVDVEPQDHYLAGARVLRQTRRHGVRLGRRAAPLRLEQLHQHRARRGHLLTALWLRRRRAGTPPAEARQQPRSHCERLGVVQLLPASGWQRGGEGRRAS
jgi:hypothetical protein